MAVVSRLSNNIQTVTYDFLTGALKPKDGTVTRTPNGDGWMTSSMILVSRNVADATIISAVNSIDELAEKCDLYWEDLHRTESIWLEENATSEQTKRSLIQSIEIIPVFDGWFTPLLGKKAGEYQLTIIHSAVWEYAPASGDETLQTVGDTDVALCGGLMVLPAIDGSYPARIDYSSFESNNGTCTTLWAGIRPKIYGDTDFVALWECELASLWTATVSSDSDNASPLGSSDNIITYAATTAETKISSLTLGQVYAGTSFSHFYGDYLVLLRSRVDVAQSVKVEMREGMYGDTRELRHQPVYFSSTDWHYYEMGTISIPPWPRETSAQQLLDAYSLRLYVTLMGTATNFLADCFVLIPSAHMIKVKDFSMAQVGDYLDVFNQEDGQVVARMYDASENIMAINASCNFNNWEYPIEGGLIVLAGEDTTGSQLRAAGSNLIIDLWYLERYRTHGE